MTDEPVKHKTPMTEIDISKVLIEGDTATINGIKYKRVETPQSFYDKLWQLLNSKIGDNVDTDETADRIFDLIKDTIPEPYEGMGLPEYAVGFNDCVKRIKNKLN